jgi:hypothetical protein
VPDFNPDYYSKLVFSTTGITQKVRRDLHGGVSLEGLAVHNDYQEVSIYAAVLADHANDAADDQHLDRAPRRRQGDAHVRGHQTLRERHRSLSPLAIRSP